MNRRIILLMGIILAVLIVCFGYILRKNLHVAKLPQDIVDSEHLGVLASSFGELQPFSDSLYISLSENKRLCIVYNGKRTQIASAVIQFATLDNGVAYRNESGTVSIFSEEKSVDVATNVHSICSDKKELIFYCKEDHGIYIFRDGLCSLMVTLPDEAGDAELIATESWVVSTTSRGAYYFNREDRKLGFIEGASDLYNDESFIYKDYLITVGCYATGGMAYSLKTGVSTPIDLGWNGTEHVTTISVAADEKEVYISLKSKIWPQFGQEEYKGTFLLDLDNMKVIRINGKYYENLLLTSSALYGGNLAELQFIDKR